MPQWLDPTYLLPALGPWVLPVACLIVFAECGLLLGGVALVRDHIELMIVAIVLVSVIPVAVEALRSRRTVGSRS